MFISEQVCVRAITKPHGWHLPQHLEGKKGLIRPLAGIYWAVIAYWVALTLANFLVMIDRMNKEDFVQHLAEITGGMSRRRIAEKSGIGRSTLVAQLAKLEDQGRRVPMETIVAICRAFNAPFLPAIVAAGYLTQEEADLIASGKSVTLSEVSDKELAAETLRRLTAGKAARNLTEPMEEADAEVIPLHRENSLGESEDQDDDLDLDHEKVARKIDKPKLGEHTDD